MKEFESFSVNNILIKLAQTEEEKNKLYKLRYQELLLEYDDSKQFDSEIDKDDYDEYCDHLIAIDTDTDNVVGTYRLIKKSHLKTLKTFLTESEFNIDNIKKYELLELGRAVVKKEYRDGSVISLLWKGVIRYALSNEIEIMIGTASFHDISPVKYSDTLSYLLYNHLSPDHLRCYSVKDDLKAEYLNPNYNLENAKKQMPPLIKGYVNLGATIGDGVFIDESFNSVDVLIVLVIKEINPRYLKRYL